MQNPRDKSGYLSEETISAISTEVGGAISIVRVSGPRAFETLARLTQQNPLCQSVPRQLVRSPLFLENGQLLDDALFVRFIGPNSFTGEDLVEYHIHGGGYIAHRLMETLQAYGARQALPGEFSFRGFKNGKMSLYQAQALVDLLSASNDRAVTLALEKMTGSQNQALKELSTGLRKMSALGEIGIDFSDQDIPEVSLSHLVRQLEPYLLLLKQLQNSYSRGLRLQDGIKVAFVGLPNVGKSSFFNALLGEDRSIVSEIAGTTRDVIRERLTLRGKASNITLRLEDTAGLRATDHAVEKIGIERTVQSARQADLILFLMDPSLSIEPAREQWLHLQQSLTLASSDAETPLSMKTLGILTQCDRLDSTQIPKLIQKAESLGISTWAPTSALTGVGIPEAIEKIVAFCENWTQRDPGEILLTRLDHVAAVSSATEHLERARQAPEIDLFASDIRQALHALGPLIGETLPDDILGKIFSEFCIGK